MSKNNSFLVILAVFILIFGAGVIGYFYVVTNRTSNPTGLNVAVRTPTITQERVDVDTIARNDFDPETRKISKGTFEKAESGKIILKNGDTLTEFPLHREVIVVCTDNNIDVITSVEYDVEEMKLYGPDRIGTIISPNQSIAIVTQEIEGVATVHTIAVSSESCPE